MSDAEAPILALAGVTKSYGADGVVTPVLHGIDLSLEKGEFTALIGPSGSGKSTLLHIIGLLEKPSDGRVAICSRETTTLAEPDISLFRGATIGFVFQFHHLIPAFTARENVMLPLMLAAGRRLSEHRIKAADLLEKVGLADRMDFKPQQLSGGQQQRVAIARALAADPPLILADEPTGNLDTATADEVFSLLRTISLEAGTTFLLVTHDPRLASRCDRSIQLIDGRIVS